MRSKVEQRISSSWAEEKQGSPINSQEAEETYPTTHCISTACFETLPLHFQLKDIWFAAEFLRKYKPNRSEDSFSSTSWQGVCTKLAAGNSRDYNSYGSL